MRGARPWYDFIDGDGTALPCAVDANRASRQAGVPFQIRIGVAVGDVELDAGDYFGLSVVQAARLCESARGGEILVTDLVKTLAGTWVEISYGPAMAMSLKGISSEVTAHRVDWHTSGELAGIADRRPGFVPTSCAVAGCRRYVACLAIAANRAVASYPALGSWPGLPLDAVPAPSAQQRRRRERHAGLTRPRRAPRA